MHGETLKILKGYKSENLQEFLECFFTMHVMPRPLAPLLNIWFRISLSSRYARTKSSEDLVRRQVVLNDPMKDRNVNAKSISIF
jgi:hypothetical protein